MLFFFLSADLSLDSLELTDNMQRSWNPFYVLLKVYELYLFCEGNGVWTVGRMRLSKYNKDDEKMWIKKKMNVLKQEE